MANLTPTNSSKHQLEILFTKCFDKDALLLKASRDFNDASWAAWFGEIQQSMRIGRWQVGNKYHPITTCHIDFSACRWADPIPLLSLGLSILEMERKGTVVRITLPDEADVNAIANTRDEYDDGVARNRFLKFLASEGFLDFLACPQVALLSEKKDFIRQPARIVRLGKTTIQPNSFHRLKDLPVPSAFSESTCVPACVICIDHVADQNEKYKLDAIDRWVDRTLELAETVITNNVPNWAQRSVRYRLLMVLRETLHNVAEHAYKSTGCAAVYVRYREGALGQAPNAWAALERFIRREESDHKVPLMKTGILLTSFARSRSGFFELYVVDAGRGLSRTLKRRLRVANPLHQSMLDVFQRWCSSKHARLTEYGGLYLIRLLLEPVRDYVRVRDMDSWWGTDLPMPENAKGARPSGAIARDIESHRHSGKSVRGLAWTIRISWLERTDVSQLDQLWYGLTPKKGREAAHSILQSGTDDVAVLDRVAIRDCRLTGEEVSNFNSFRRSTFSTLTLLPSSNWMRNGIQEEIRNTMKTGALKKQGCVLIGDISPEEGLIYVAAIKNSRIFEESPFQIIGKIILVTTDLRACVFVRGRESLFIPSRQLTREYVSNMQILASSPDQSLLSYLKVLRLHDARRMWETVVPPKKKNSTRKTNADLSIGGFVSELVDWNEGITLDGYLDFPQSLTHPLCREIYSISLRRLSGCFPEEECRYIPIDNLVESLVIRFNAQIHPSHQLLHRRLTEISIGSIQVSGNTERSRKSENSIAVHFFKHPSGTATGLYLLPWLAPSTGKTLGLPLTDERLGPRSYRRIGRTPVIARDGWKAYLMPRFDSRERSVYEQSPRESYRAWQESSRTPMKLGHWSYGGHHDLLTINLMLAFDTELDRISLAVGGPLARYVFANLFRVFGLKAENLTLTGKKILAAIETDDFRQLLPKELGNEAPLLLYPSHPVTDHVLDRFLMLIEKDFELENVRRRMLAVLPIKRNRGGSGLQISGLALERLEHLAKMKKKRPPPVVVFDDAVISGRTYEEIKRLLRGMGYHKIYSIAMLDRQRLPSIDHVENNDHVCFWRLDVPSMGGTSHCPLCRALGRIRDIRTGLASDAHLRRLKSWEEAWVPRNPTTQWGDSGLRPIPLWLTKPERKFGITRDERNPAGFRQIGGAGQEIQLTNSAGLASWVTELHSITSRDDLPLRILSQEELIPEVRIQLLSSQLLLFIGELDGDLARELGMRLLAALWDAEKHDRHTALAALTLIACGNSFLKDVITSFFDIETRQSLHLNHPDQDLNWGNMDFLILMALCLKANLLEENDWFRRASRLLMPSGEKKDFLRRLHRETQDDQGKQHSPWLHRLRTWENDGRTFFNSIGDTTASAGQIKELVRRTDPFLLGPDTTIRAKYEGVRESIVKKVTSFEEGLQQLDFEIKSPNSDAIQDVFRTCRKQASEILAAADELHDALFVSVGVQEMTKGQRCKLLDSIGHVAKRVNISTQSIVPYLATEDDNKMCVNRLDKTELDEAYVVWDAEVQWALQDILTNVRHAGIQPVECLWATDATAADGKAHLWFRVRLEKLHAVIELANTVKNGRDVLETVAKLATESPSKSSHQTFRQLGGGVGFSEKDGRVITTVRLPYAHTL